MRTIGDAIARGWLAVTGGNGDGEKPDRRKSAPSPWGQGAESGDGAPDCAGMSITDPVETAEVGNGKQPFTIAGLTRLQLRKDRPVRMREVRSIPSSKDAAVDDDAGHADQDAGL